MESREKLVKEDFLDFLECPELQGILDLKEIVDIQVIKACPEPEVWDLQDHKDLLVMLVPLVLVHLVPKGNEVLLEK